MNSGCKKTIRVDHKKPSKHQSYHQSSQFSIFSSFCDLAGTDRSVPGLIGLSGTDRISPDQSGAPGPPRAVPDHQGHAPKSRRAVDLAQKTSKHQSEGRNCVLQSLGMWIVRGLVLGAAFFAHFLAHGAAKSCCDDLSGGNLYYKI